MKNSTNQLLTLLLYLTFLFAGTILSSAKITGHAYFATSTILSVLVAGTMIYLTQKNNSFSFEAPKFDYQKVITWTLIGAIGALIIQLGLVMFEQAVLHTTISSQNTVSLLATTKGYPYYVIYVLICAPVMEEIIFRRIIFGNLIKPTNVYIAAIISALLFAFIHQDNQFSVYAFVGLWFSFVYYRSKNIYVSVTSHIIMNIVVMALSLVS